MDLWSPPTHHHHLVSPSSLPDGSTPVRDSYPPIYPPTYPLTHVTTYLVTPPTLLSTYPPICLTFHLPTYLPTHILTHPPTYLDDGSGGEKPRHTYGVSRDRLEKVTDGRRPRTRGSFREGVGRKRLEVWPPFLQGKVGR